MRAQIPSSVASKHLDRTSASQLKLVKLPSPVLVTHELALNNPNAVVTLRPAHSHITPSEQFMNSCEIASD